jgi:hypothetical protein
MFAMKILHENSIEPCASSNIVVLLVGDDLLVSRPDSVTPGVRALVAVG